MEIRVPINNTLRSGSENYTSNLGYFINFNEAHDKQKLIPEYFKNKIKDKKVLDIGCGYGKFTGFFCEHAKSYTGIDISKEELRIARKCNYYGAKLLNASALDLPFKDNTFDTVISLYGAISVVKPLRQKAKILKEVERVLKPKGSFYIVTDAFTGEWLEMKKRTKSRLGFEWLIKNGFYVIKTIHTTYEYPSYEVAFNVLHSLFGRILSKNVKKRIIKHDVVILKKVVK